MNNRKLFLVLFVICFLSTSVLSQFSPPIDPPRGAIVPNTAARNERNLEIRMQDMRTLEARIRKQDKIDSTRVVETPHFSQEMVDQIKKRRRVEQAINDKYAEFLKGEGTGIFKLFPYLDCVTNLIVRIDDDCKNFVAMSSGFSFRSKGYSDKLYHDIFFDRSGIRSFDFFSQGIIEEIGDVPIETISLLHPGIVALQNFAVNVAPEIAIENAKQLEKGVSVGGHVFVDRIEPKTGITYVMRHVAYRLANNVRPINPETSSLEMKFLSLSFDNRDDSIIVFRIIKVDADGSATIVWKQLAKEDAPKLKFPKGKSPTDLRENRNDH